MSDTRAHHGPTQHHHLVACLAAVDLAREHLQDGRSQLTSSWARPSLRGELLLALERYAEAITDVGAPVPAKLRHEIDLYRSIVNHD